MVPHHHPLGAVFAREVEQKAIAAEASRFFNAELVLERKSSHILSFTEERQPQFRHALAQGVCLGCGALAQGVIEMPDKQFKTTLSQAMDQAQAIRTTRNPHHQWQFRVDAAILDQRLSDAFC